MVGKQLAHFEIVDLLGEGGMGVVYRALDHHLGRQVALKILPADKTSNAARKERFVQEARAASALNHPNIVTVYDISTADGVDYIAMELVSGRTLEDLLSKRRLKLQEALKYAVQIADALAAAHAAGIVHRDLKPANIMVTDAGVVKVLDFGLAKLTQQTEPSADDATRTERVLTDERTIVGSAGYMSPEQAEGRSVDARSDIFSFGLVLYEMLSGTRAFEEDTRMATIAAIVHKDPAPLSTVAPGLPKELERIVSRCLRKDLTRRSQSIAESKIALEELREESESGASASVTPPMRTVSRRTMWIAIAASTLALAGVGSVGLTRWRSAPAAFTETPLTTYAGHQRQPTFSPDGNQFAFVWDGGVENGPSQLYVRTIAGGAPLRLTNTVGTFVHTPAWSPDGQTIAFVRNKTGSATGDLMLISPLGGTEKKIDEGEIGRIDWSPDGKWLYFSARTSGDRRGIFVNSSTGGQRQLLVDPPAGTFGDRDASVSPDGKRLVFVRAFADFNYDLFVVDLHDGEHAGAPRRLTYDHRSTYWPVWTVDGNEVVYIAGEGYGWLRVYRVRDTGGTPSPLPFVGAEYAETLAVARTGHRLIYGRGFFDVNMYKMTLPHENELAGQPLEFLSSNRLDYSPTFSPDGKRVVFASNRMGVDQIFVADADGSNVAPLTSFKAGVAGSPKWSPDGESIVFDARPEGLSDVYSIQADGSNLKRLTDHRAEDHMPCYSADGRWIYFTSTRSGPRQIYRMPASGGEAEQMTRNGAGVPLASPDGVWVYYSKLDGSLWKIAANGGEETRVFPPATLLEPFGFAVTRVGIYYAGPRDPTSRTIPLRLYRFADAKTIDITHFDKALQEHVSVSPDERWFAWAQVDSSVNDLVLVENFR
jgi:serine/threonine protein kinase/Tol biopolymer transport system component